MAKRKLIQQITIKRHGDLPENCFAYAMASINGKKEIGIVTDMTRKSLLQKCERYDKDIRTITVRIVKVYERI